ncbi:hypothetical protein ACNQFN_06260 [Thauera butanivorans]|uniref:hypothetical protein n=1 Tax=Thauera butanivorans TaxID=86174 RepID=UPI003AB19273
MQPRIHLFDGVRFVANPYRAGSYLREDVFWRQFNVICRGEAEYLEDDPALGTWRAPCVVDVGQCGLIEEAMALAEAWLSQDDPACGDDCDALSFAPALFVIRDRDGRHVLAGEAREGRVRWCPPVASDLEAEEVIREAGKLHDEAAYETGWDNFCTAEELCRRARLLEGRLVDRCWREHARKALLAAAT